MLSTNPSYDNRTIASTLKMQIWIATNNRDLPRVMKTKFPATVMVFGVVSSEGHIMPPHIFEVNMKVNTKVYVDVLKSVVIPGAIRWPVADPECSSRTRRRPTSPKRPRLGFRRSTTTLYLLSLPTLFPDLNPQDYFVWSYIENITNMTSHNTKASLIAAIPRVFAELPLALVEKACSQSGSVSRRWLSLKVATLNRCQLYYIIQLPELIFFNKSFKIKL